MKGSINNLSVSSLLADLIFAIIIL